MEKIKIPRKLKKQLKKALLSKIDPAWKSKEIRIDGIRKTSINNFHRGEPGYKGTVIKSYRLV